MQTVDRDRHVVAVIIVTFRLSNERFVQRSFDRRGQDHRIADNFLEVLPRGNFKDHTVRGIVVFPLASQCTHL
jgi:hypothetical protein